MDLFVRGLRRAPAGTLLMDSRACEGAPGISLSTDSGTYRAPQSSGLTLRMTDDNGITVNASIAPTSQCAAWLHGDDESHYVGVSVDGAPGIVTFVVDGVLCDGIAVPPAQNEIRGWVTFGLLGNVTGSGPLRLGVSNKSVAGCSVLRARLFPRFLLTSEMIGNARAGAVSAATDASLQ